MTMHQPRNGPEGARSQAPAHHEEHEADAADAHHGEHVQQPREPDRDQPIEGEVKQRPEQAGRRRSRSPLPPRRRAARPQLLGRRPGRRAVRRGRLPRRGAVRNYQAPRAPGPATENRSSSHPATANRHDRPTVTVSATMRQDPPVRTLAGPLLPCADAHLRTRHAEKLRYRYLRRGLRQDLRHVITTERRRCRTWPTTARQLRTAGRAAREAGRADRHRSQSRTVRVHEGACRRRGGRAKPVRIHPGTDSPGRSRRDRPPPVGRGRSRAACRRRGARRVMTTTAYVPRRSEPPNA